jgi:hypothetical protein
MIEIPEEFKRGLRLLERHKLECAPYRESYDAASRGILQRMQKYSPAWALPEITSYQEGVLLEGQLLTATVCPTPETQRIFRETACRLEPYGCVSARACEFGPGRHYIVLDTGAGDFFGNMASLLVGLYEQELGNDAFGLNEQAMVSKFWGLALIYYDHGFTTNNEALLYPHFKYKRLNPRAEPYARVLSTAAQQFFLYHEFGHVVDGLVDSSSGTEETEYSADLFAFTAIRETALAAYEKEVISYTILGCLLALLSIDFIESTFPGLAISRGGAQKVFPIPLSSYPPAKSRLQKLLSYFPPAQTRMLNSYKLFLFMQKVFHDYSQRIKDGARPSKEYWDLQEFKLDCHRKGLTCRSSDLI